MVGLFKIEPEPQWSKRLLTVQLTFDPGIWPETWPLTPLLRQADISVTILEFLNSKKQFFKLVIKSLALKIQRGLANQTSYKWNRTQVAGIRVGRSRCLLDHCAPVTESTSPIDS